MENSNIKLVQNSNSTPPPPPATAYISNPTQLKAEKKIKEKVKLFTILHFVFSGLSLLGLGFIFLHYKIMNFVFSNEEFFKSTEKQKDLPFNPETFFEIFKLIYLAFGILAIISIVINFLNGSLLSKMRNRMTSIILSAINCIFFPLGTALGIATIYHLQKDEFINLYEKSQ